MRMSGLCKVGMSGFMGGRGAYGDGADRLEPRRTGPIAGVARVGARGIKAGCGGAADEVNRPSGAPVAAALAQGRRQGGDPQVAGATLESEVLWLLPTEGLGSRGSALCRLRAHAGRRALGAGRDSAEPRDLAEMDDRSDLLASRPPAREKDPRLAGAQGQLRGVGN